MLVSDGVDEDNAAEGGGDVVADGDAGVDADGGADAICTAFAGDDAEESAGAAEAAAGPDGIRSERCSAPSEPMLKLKLPNVSSIASGMLAKVDCSAGGCGVNSKEPKKIGSARAVDAEESADEAPTTSRLPTDGAN